MIPLILTMSPNLSKKEFINVICISVFLFPSGSVSPVAVMLLIPIILSLAVEKNPFESTAKKGILDIFLKLFCRSSISLFVPEPARLSNAVRSSSVSYKFKSLLNPWF